MTVLCILSQIATWAAVIGTFFVISPWYHSLVLILASYAIEAVGVLAHLVPGNVIIRFLSGAVLFTITFCNFVFGWLQYGG